MTRVYARKAFDTCLPVLDRLGLWRVFREGAVCREGELDFQFVEYLRE